uniref:Uncharacterized protein n=1 Tax=uncultured marine virus TaxID=186617 RepID=A0A0F7L4S5_9VIRU|nr:hypothetical protein [uncultured marine virus]
MSKPCLNRTAIFYITSGKLYCNRYQCHDCLYCFFTSHIHLTLSLLKRLIFQPAKNLKALYFL